MAVNSLEADGAFGKTTPSKIERAVADAVTTLAQAWETKKPVPPAVIWRHTKQVAQDLALKALAYSLSPLPKQTSWTEVPFGVGSVPETDRHNLPWKANQKVEIPGTGLHIRGYIDRLDVAADWSVARVIDYKTGRVKSTQAEIKIDGGSELQRCLYAFAVKTLLGPKVKVEAALLFPRAEDGKGLFPLADVEEMANDLARFIGLARINLENGLALPGIDAADDDNDLAFALPANSKASYLARIGPLVEKKLGKAAKIWELE